MAELDTQDREKLDKRKFAYVDKEGEGHLPINDEAHVRNAMARFNQTDFESGTKKETARKKIVTAAKRRGIKVAKASRRARSPNHMSRSPRITAYPGQAPSRREAPHSRVEHPIVVR